MGSCVLCVYSSQSSLILSKSLFSKFDNKGGDDNDSVIETLIFDRT